MLNVGCCWVCVEREPHYFSLWPYKTILEIDHKFLFITPSQVSPQFDALGNFVIRPFQGRMYVIKCPSKGHLTVPSHASTRAQRPTIRQDPLRQCILIEIMCDEFAARHCYGTWLISLNDTIIIVAAITHNTTTHHRTVHVRCKEKGVYPVAASISTTHSTRRSNKRTAAQQIRNDGIV